MQTYRTKTKTIKASEVSRNWEFIDASEQVLGRLACQIAVLLQGKHKPTYTPHLDGGDYVVVTNASKIVLTRGKADKKLYWSHSNYPGGLKKETFATLQKRKPEEIVFLAVKNMLPNNRLRSQRLARLKVYPSSTHPHGSYSKQKKEPGNGNQEK